MVKLTEGEKTLYNEMVKERKDAYENDLRTVMQMGAHSKGTKFGPGGKVLGSSGLGPTTDSNRYRRALRTALARHIDAKDPKTQLKNTVNAYNPVTPLDAKQRFSELQREKKSKAAAAVAAARNLEGRRATAATLRDEANKPKTHDVGFDPVGDENREKQGSYGKGRSGGRKTRRRNRKKSQRKKSQRKKSHKKSKRHRRH